MTKDKYFVLSAYSKLKSECGVMFLRKARVDGDVPIITLRGHYKLEPLLNMSFDLGE